MVLATGPSLPTKKADYPFGLYTPETTEKPASGSSRPTCNQTGKVSRYNPKNL